jgi:hypothetical protein
MYWCKPLNNKKAVPSFGRNTLFVFLLGATLLPSCRPDNIKKGAKLKYFDLKGYFMADTARLNKLTGPISKTVSHNNVTESKKVVVKNWGNELGLFFASDINKPAWQESYTIQGDSNLIIYRAKDPELKTREIIINKPNNKVKWILIFNSTKNMLYQTTEKLSYFPDSAYVIVKYQKVRLLGANTYKITGTFN